MSGPATMVHSIEHSNPMSPDEHNIHDGSGRRLSSRSKTQAVARSGLELPEHLRTSSRQRMFEHKLATEGAAAATEGGARAGARASGLRSTGGRLSTTHGTAAQTAGDAVQVPSLTINPGSFVLSAQLIAEARRAVRALDNYQKNRT